VLSQLRQVTIFTPLRNLIRTFLPLENGKEHLRQRSNLAFVGKGNLFFLLTANNCLAEDFDRT